MSFFKKLRDRMFKSSSKIDEGLDAIVSDGGEEEVVEAGATEEAADQVRAAEDARQEAERQAEDAR
ncbi:MAG: signal recognition particle-docking protein FtsY, partial [Pseudomonadota bacterium]